MFFPELFTAVILAFVLVFFFGLVFGRRGPWNGLGWFFLVVFLGAWAVGTWSTPIGPSVFGVAWVPFFFGAFIVALLIAAISEKTPSAPRAEADSAEERRRAEAERARKDTVAVGAFFWALVLVLLIVIVVGIGAAA